MEIDRSEVARALAKAIAYKSCGKDSEADAWASKLVQLLGCAGILANGGDDSDDPTSVEYTDHHAACKAMSPGRLDK